jgi:hypothetical protein
LHYTQHVAQSTRQAPRPLRSRKTRKLSDNASSTLTLISARVVKNRTKGRAEAKAVRDDVEAGETLLTTDQATLRGLTDQRIGQTNEVNYRLNELANTLRELNLRVTLKVDRDLTDPRYRAVFVKTPNEALRTMSQDELSRYTHGVLAQLAAEPTFASIPTSEVADALANFDGARATRETLYGQESAARGAVHSARLSLIQIINLAFPRLTVIYPKQKALVESLFYKPAKGDTID